ncbi:hypothetical protein Gotur_016121 [Gossypium turneri]
MLEGLKLAWAQGFRQVELESDNAWLIDVIQNGLAVDNNCSEIRLILDWCSKDWDVKLRHILRDNPLPYVRDLLEEDVQRPMHTMVDGE